VEADQIAIIIGAMFSGFSGLIWSAGKTYRLLNQVGKNQERNDALIEAKIRRVHEDVAEKLVTLDNRLSVMEAKSVWADDFKVNLKKSLETHIEKVKEENDKLRDDVESHKKWLTSETVRISEKKKGESK